MAPFSWLPLELWRAGALAQGEFVHWPQGDCHDGCATWIFHCYNLVHDLVRDRPAAQRLPLLTSYLSTRRDKGGHHDVRGSGELWRRRGALILEE